MLEFDRYFKVHLKLLSLGFLDKQFISIIFGSHLKTDTKPFVQHILREPRIGLNLHILYKYHRAKTVLPD